MNKTNRNSYMLSVLAILAAIGLLQSRTVCAADRIKQNNATALNLAASWDTLPTSLDVGVWNSTVLAANAPALGASVSWLGTRIATPGGAVTIGTTSEAFTFTLGTSGVDMSSAGPNLLLNNSLVITGNQTWTVANGRTLAVNTINISHPLTGSGNLNLVNASGTGTAIFNFQPGASGSVVFTNDGGSFFAYTGNWTINSGVEVRTLRNGANAWGSGTVNLAGGFVAQQDNFNGTWTNSFVLQNATTSTIGDRNSSGARSLKMNGVISGSGNLVFDNSSGLVTAPDSAFTLTGANTMSGTVTVGGVLNATHLRVGGINGTDTTFTAGTTGTLGTAAVVISSACDLTLARSNTWTFANAMSGAGALRIGGAVASAGTQSVTLSGTNTYTGGSALAQGTLVFGSTTAIGTGTLTITGGSLDSAVANLVNANNNAQAWNADFSFVGTNNLNLGNGAVTLGAARTVTVTAGTLAVGGPVGGAFALTKAGAGTLLLSGANGYTGLTTVSAGTLQLGNASALGTTAAGTSVTPGAVLDLNAQALGAESLTLNGTGISSGGALLNSSVTAASYAGTITLGSNSSVGGSGSMTLSGAIGGGFALTKVGAGTLSLTATNGYTGNTTVSVGTLALGASASIATSPVITVSPAAVFDVSAVTGGFILTSSPTAQTLIAGRTGAPATDVNGSVTSNGATLDVAGIGTAATMSVNGDTALNGGSIKLDLSNTPASGNDQLAVTGNLTLSGTVTITPNLLNGALTTGTYTLITYTGSLTGNASNLSITLSGSGSSRQSFMLDSSTAGQINLIVGGNTATDTWTGSTSAVWDINTTPNWTNPSPGDQFFFNLDNVNFNDTSTVGGVTLNTTVSPSSMLFNNSTTNYAISGSGTITGSTGATLNGTASVALSTPNAFSGVIALNNGTLVLGNASAIGTGTLTIAGGTAIDSALPSLVNSGNNPQNWNGNFTFVGTNSLNLGTGAVTLNSNSQVTVSNNILTVGGNISGGFALTKAGAGTLTLTGTNSYTGGSTISAGRLQANSTGSLAGAVSVGASGTLILNTSTNGATTTWSNTITGSGLLKFLFSSAGNGTGADNIIVPGVTSFTGTIELANSVTTSNKWNVTAGVNVPGATVLIDANNQLWVGGGTSTFSAIKVSSAGNSDNRGAIRLAGTLNGPVSLLGNTTIGTEAGTINGSITNGQTNTPATLTLGTANSNGGGTFNGAISDGSGTSTTALLVAVGTETLSGTNTYSGGAVINSGATLQPKMAAQGSAGTFTGVELGTGTVTLNSGSALYFLATNINTPTSHYNYSNNFTFNGGTLSSEDADVHLQGTLNFLGNTTLRRKWGFASNAAAAAKSLVIDGVVSGSSGTTLTLQTLNTIANSETGVTIFTNNANTFSGTASVDNVTNAAAGTALVIGGNTAMQNTTINLNGNTTTTSTGILNHSIIFAAGITAPVIGSLSGSGNVTLQTTAGSGAPIALMLGNNSTSNTYSGILSGPGSVIKVGTGVQTMTGANNYAGGTTVNAGTLTANGSSGLGAATGSLTVNNPNTGAGTDVVLNLSATAATTTGSLRGALSAPASGTNTATINNGGQAFTVNQTTYGTFAGVIAGSGSLALGTLSTGALRLNGTNTYTGTTVINAGDLRGIGSLTASTVTATGNASTASIWPGVALVPSQMPNNSNEIFNVAGADLSSSTANAGGKLKIVIGNGFAQVLNVTNTCNLTNATLSLSVNSASNSSYGIVTANTITGGFSTVIVNGASTPVTGNGLNDQVAGPVTVSYSTNAVVVTVNTGVTPVKLDAFQATSRGAGVDVSWIAVSEFKNAGFNVYRRSVGTMDWTRCNSALISGRITNADEKQYSFYDWTSAGTFEYKLESVGLNDEREAFFSKTGAVTVDWNTALTAIDPVTQDTVDAALGSMALDASVAQANEVTTWVNGTNGRVGESASGRLPNAQVRTFGIADSPTRTLAVSTVPTTLSATNAAAGVRWFTSGTPASTASASSYSVAKLVYVSSGVMLIPQVSMPAGYDINHVSLQREGRYFSALAITPAGLLVYLPGYADDYTNKDAVFLRRIAGNTAVGSSAPATGLFTSGLQPNVTSTANVSADYHDVYFDYGYRPYNFAPWFSAQYLTQGTTQNFTLTTPLPTSGSATITINLWSLTDSTTVNPDHGLTVSINDVLCGTQSWDGGNQMLQFKFTIPANALTNGANTISLTTPTIAGQDSQIAFVHSMSVSYTRLLDASQTLSVTNSTGAAQMYELYNVPAAGAYVVDTRFTDHGALVATQTVAQPDGTQHMRFIAANGGSGQFLIVPVGQETSALSITARQVKALRLTGTYLATGPNQFASGIQPLLTARAKEGLRGSYADQEALFDYYNYGRYGPDGIRKAVRSVHPTYLLLLGRTTYDYRNYSGLNIDPLCPAFLVSTSFWAQTTSDSAFGDLGRGYSEVSVGRLPIGSAADLNTAVSRILAYKGLPSTGSGVRVHGVADRADPDAGDFAAQLASLQAAHPDLTWQTNDLGVTYQTAGEVHSAMSDAANGGADLIMYAGHGNASRLGKVDPRILDNNTISDWKGNVVFIQATCTANWDANNAIGYKSIAMTAMTQPNGGISASIASSTYMNSYVATDFMNQLLKNASASTNARWGTVLMKTQQWAAQKGGASSFYTDMSSAEQIFGDPAMRIYAAPTRTTVTGSSASSSTSGTQAGSF